MIIISDCVRNNLDEGCIKVASSLSRRLKEVGAKLIAVNCECSYADKRISADKLFLTKSIYSSIDDIDGNILYIPFASNTLGTAIRVWNLHRKSKKEVTVLFTLRWEMKLLTKLLFGLSKARVITISEESYAFFSKELKQLEIVNVKTGVDSEVFTEIDDEYKKTLRKKYGIPIDKTVVLHVGHLKHGRNVDVFLDVDDRYYVVLVFSSVTEQDNDLKKQLQNKDNIKIIEDYLPNVEEIYQASDIYVFPTNEANNSIDIPLSVLEAAGCNKKILTTAYKEIAYFDCVPGLKRIGLQESFSINNCIEELEKQECVCTKKIAKEYDWNASISNIFQFVDDGIM